MKEDKSESYIEVFGYRVSGTAANIIFVSLFLALMCFCVHFAYEAGVRHACG